MVLGQNPRATGAISIYEMEKGQVKQLSSGAGEKPKGFKCGTFNASSVEERHLATGDYGGKLAIWDLDRLEKPVWEVQAHEKIINCVEVSLGF